VNAQRALIGRESCRSPRRAKSRICSFRWVEPTCCPVALPESASGAGQDLVGKLGQLDRVSYGRQHSVSETGVEVPEVAQEPQAPPRLVTAECPLTRAGDGGKPRRSGAPGDGEPAHRTGPVDDGVAMTAPRATSRDILRHNASNCAAIDCDAAAGQTQEER
jgi:hypothetical protein